MANHFIYNRKIMDDLKQLSAMSDEPLAVSDLYIVLGIATTDLNMLTY